MKLFRHSSGIIISFGFDMQSRAPDSEVISWSDTNGKEWDVRADNSAGYLRLWKGSASPEFIFEADGKVIAYQPGLCIEMTYVGAPLVWSFRFLRPDEYVALAA